MIDSPEAALQALKDGNDRFLHALSNNTDLLARVSETAAVQHPFALVLTCADSRMAPELIFDQGIGDIFTVRIAGNLVTTEILGTMEFATQLVGAKLIVVLGHTNCGALKGAVDGIELGNLTATLDHLRPAVDAVPSSYGEPTSANPHFLQKAAELNVIMAEDQIRRQSPVIAKLVVEGRVAVRGAMYHMETGAVTFLTEGAQETVDTIGARAYD